MRRLLTGLAVAVLVLGGCGTIDSATARASASASTAAAQAKTVAAAKAKAAAAVQAKVVAAAKAKAHAQAVGHAMAVAKAQAVAKAKEAAGIQAQAKTAAEVQRRTRAEQPPAPIGRDANGFALGGPPSPVGPANYDHPSHSDCLKHLQQVRAWSDYQNQHRPAGSTNDLPSSGDVQYLYVVCGLRY